MKKIIALAVAGVIAAPAMADLTIGGNAEYNLSSTDGAAAVSTLETNLTVAASTTSEGGLTVAAFTEFEAMDAGDADTTLDIDDQYLSIGNDMATVTLGYNGGFATKDAFALGADAAAQAPTGNYGASATERDADVAVTLAPAEGVTFQVSGNAGNASNAYSVYVGADLGMAVVAASYENGGTDATTGYAASVSADLGGVTLGADYARNQADTSAAVVKAGMGAVSIAYAAHDLAGSKVSDVYGEYAVGEIAPGAALTLAAGSSEGSTKLRVKLAYTF